MRKLKEVINLATTPYIVVAGDLNSYSHWWGCDEENAGGSEIVDFLSENSFNVLNQGSSPTFYTHCRGKLYASIVDVTTCSDTMLSRINNWELIERDTGLSDHRRIRFGLLLGRGAHTELPKTTRCFNTGKADWAAFAATLNDGLATGNLTVEAVDRIVTAAELEDMVSRLVDTVRGLVRWRSQGWWRRGT